jgi:hypothetical protein
MPGQRVAKVQGRHSKTGSFLFWLGGGATSLVKLNQVRNSPRM